MPPSKCSGGTTTSVNSRSSKWIPRIGGKWRFKSADPTDKLEGTGVRDFEAHGKSVELDPPRPLAYTWIANWHDMPERSSLVRWESRAPQRLIFCRSTASRTRRHEVWGQGHPESGAASSGS